MKIATLLDPRLKSLTGFPETEKRVAWETMINYGQRALPPDLLEYPPPQLQPRAQRFDIMHYIFGGDQAIADSTDHPLWKELVNYVDEGGFASKIRSS